jgi:hypothetical protein
MGRRRPSEVDLQRIGEAALVQAMQGGGHDDQVSGFHFRFIDDAPRLAEHLQ